MVIFHQGCKFSKTILVRNFALSIKAFGRLQTRFANAFGYVCLFFQKVTRRSPRARGILVGLNPMISCGLNAYHVPCQILLIDFLQLGRRMRQPIMSYQSISPAIATTGQDYQRDIRRHNSPTTKPLELRKARAVEDVDCTGHVSLSRHSCTFRRLITRF